MAILRGFSVVLALAFMGGQALAQEVPSTGQGGGNSFPSLEPYISFDVSGGWTNDPTTSAGYTADIGMQLGASVGLGVRMGPILAELQYEEHTFFLNNLNPGPGGLDYDGDVDVYAMTAQVIMEFSEGGLIRPYAGASGGIAGISVDYHEDVCLFCAPGAPYIAESDFAAVWSTTLGVNIGSGGVQYYAGYRHFRTDDFNVTAVSGLPISHKGLRSDSIELGIRVSLD